MTSDAITIAREGPEDLELGHPVRSFVAVLVLIGALLLGIQWTGAVQPLLTNPGGGGGTEGDGVESRLVRLQNDGLLPVEVQGIDWPTPGWTDTHLAALPAGITFPGELPTPGAAGAEPVEPFTLEPGEDGARWIVLTGRPACPNQPTAATLQVHARTWLGVERRVNVGTNDAVDDFGFTPGDEGSCP